MPDPIEGSATSHQAVRVLGFGEAPKAKALGYSFLVDVVIGSAENLCREFAGVDVILVTGAALFRSDTSNEFAVYGRPAPAGALARIRSIELDREEGVRSAGRFRTFAAANSALLAWAETAPRDYGYDKVSVSLTWVDGTEFQYRLDLKHPSTGETPSIEADLAHCVGFALRELRNPLWSDAQHRRVDARYEAQGLVATAQRLRKQCLLHDEGRSGLAAVPVA